jgi:hypothetical protein
MKERREDGRKETTAKIYGQANRSHYKLLVFINTAGRMDGSINR